MEQPRTPRRGEVYDCAVPVGDGQTETVRVVVVSNDVWNQNPPDGRILAIPIKRQRGPLGVQLTETDHIGGWVQIHGLGMVPRKWLSKPVSMLSGQTMQRIREALSMLQEDTDPQL